MSGKGWKNFVYCCNIILLGYTYSCCLWGEYNLQDNMIESHIINLYTSDIKSIYNNT